MRQINTKKHKSQEYQQPLQSLPVSNYTNSLCNICDKYPNIYITRFRSNKSMEYHYKVLRLGYYPSHIKMTKRTTTNRVWYPISTNYIIRLNIYRVEATCLTEYQFNKKVKFIVNWVSNKNKEESVTKNENSRLSGIILFGFDLNCLDQK
ncbi:40034_t:CDS:2, partial [Gigaspora margarita]